MKFNELKKFDSSLQLLHPKIWSQDVLGPSTTDQIKDGFFYFIKNKKFWREFLKIKSAEDCSDLAGFGLIFDAKFYSQSSELINQNDLKDVGWFATTNDVDIAICKLSKPFYDLKFRDINLIVDGRTTGTIEIDQHAEISEKAFIGENVRIGKGVKIYPNATVMANVEIKDGSEIFPNVTIYPHVIIGKSCRIHSGSIIGSDGFGYHFHQDQHIKIWHFGGVVIGDDVEVGANACVDSGTFTPTTIGAGSKIDNHVQIAHNCQVGKKTIFCGQAALAGSCRIGDYAVFGGKAAATNNVTLGARSKVAGGAMINCDWPSESELGGHPARKLREWMKGLAYVRRESLRKQ